MSLMLKVKFEGGKELEKALLEMKTATAKAVVRRAGKKALIPFRDKAIAFAPYGENSGADGHIRDAISISTKQRRGLKKKSRIEIYAGVATAQGKVASQQEFGNINHGPQAFLRPAWDATSYTVLENVRDEMWIDIRKTAERAARKALKLKK